MALKAYDLPTISSVVGNFKIRVYSSDTTLTAPTVDTILEIGEKSETVDAALGITELGKLQLRIRDDYSVTAYGFWYAALAAGECYIRVMLTETTDKYYFVGTVQQDATKWDEHSLYVTPASVQTYIRTAEITVIDMMSVMMDTAVVTWATEILTHEAATGDPTDVAPHKTVTLQQFFASLLKASGLNASFSASDVSFVYDATKVDIDYYYNSGGGDVSYTLEDLLVATEYYDTGNTPTTGDTFWWTGSYKFSDLFSTARDLLPVLLRNIGCVLRMSYDSSTETASALGTHKIQIIQRGHAFADASNLVFANAPKSSQIQKSFDMLGDAVLFRPVSQAVAGSNFWYSRQYKGTTIQTSDPSDFDYITFNIDSQYLFGSSYVGASNNLDHAFWVVDGGGQYVNPSAKYWNYESGAYSAGVTIMNAIASYFFYRFTAIFGKITRTYGGITVSDGSTTSFQHLSILRRTSINDGTGADTFYANAVRIKPQIAETEVEWFKE